MKITSKKQLAGILKPPAIIRTIHPSLFRHIKRESEITVLYGPRQVGKSYEVARCMEALLSEGTKKDIFFYNLDVIPDELESPDSFMATIRAQKTYQKTKTYVFLDEAQRLPNVGLFVKYIYDQGHNIKFVLTGSASLDIKSNIKEPLTGRKKEFFLAPLTLREIASFRGIHPARVTSLFPLLESILGEYLLFGGYPAVVTSQTKYQKIEKLTEIASSYITRDISAFFDFPSPKTIQLVGRFLGESIGSLLNRDNISKIAGITKHQTEKALDALEKSFIILLVPPFTGSPSKELMHRPKVYFQDVGVRNALLNKLDQSFVNPSIGPLFENAVALELLSLYGRQSLKFWRTGNQTEVDFVVSNNDRTSFAIEAKYLWEKEGNIPKNLQSIRNQYPDIISKTMIISKSNYWKLFFPP